MSTKTSMSETNTSMELTAQMYTVLHVDYSAMRTGERTERENVWIKYQVNKAVIRQIFVCLHKKPNHN